MSPCSVRPGPCHVCGVDLKGLRPGEVAQCQTCCRSMCLRDQCSLAVPQLAHKGKGKAEVAAMFLCTTCNNPQRDRSTRQKTAQAPNLDLQLEANRTLNQTSTLNGSQMRKLQIVVKKKSYLMQGTGTKSSLYLPSAISQNTISKLRNSKLLSDDEPELGFRYVMDSNGISAQDSRALLLAIIMANPKCAMDWAVDKGFRPGMVKYVVHVEGWEPMSHLHGKTESITDDEHAARRKKVINVTDPVLVAELLKYAKAVRAMIPPSMLAKIKNPDKTYDLTVNVSTFPQPQHHDDHEHDGRGGCIVNHYLKKGAMVVYASNEDDNKLWHRWMEEGCIYIFCGWLRMLASHGVYPLDVDQTTGKAKTIKETGLASCKMTATSRHGDPSDEDVESHNIWLAAQDPEEDKKDDAEDLTGVDQGTNQDGFQTPTTKKKKKSAGTLTVTPDYARLPNNWATSGLMAPAPTTTPQQWVRHDKLWLLKHPDVVLQPGLKLKLGRDFTECSVLVLAVGVCWPPLGTTAGSTADKVRVTVFCTTKKTSDDSTWDPPMFSSANRIIENIVNFGLTPTYGSVPKEFPESLVAGLCTNVGGRESKGSSDIWKELEDSTKAATPKAGTSKKRGRDITPIADTGPNKKAATDKSNANADADPGNANAAADKGDLDADKPAAAGAVATPTPQFPLMSLHAMVVQTPPRPTLVDPVPTSARGGRASRFRQAPAAPGPGAVVRASASDAEVEVHINPDVQAGMNQIAHQMSTILQNSMHTKVDDQRAKAVTEERERLIKAVADERSCQLITSQAHATDLRNSAALITALLKQQMANAHQLSLLELQTKAGTGGGAILQHAIASASSVLVPPSAAEEPPDVFTWLKNERLVKEPADVNLEVLADFGVVDGQDVLELGEEDLKKAGFKQLAIKKIANMVAAAATKKR